jgi:hypothetical protein
MANRKQSSDNDFAETEVLPAHLRPDRIEALDDAAAEVHGRYQEYVRSLDEVPVLVDVVREARRVGVKDFRSGQRADARKAPRDDAVALRDQHVRDAAARYAEYVEISGALEKTERAPPRRAAARNSSERGAKKKRAKRMKRSARS